MTPPPSPPNGEILLYQTEDGRTRIECRFQDETLWLSQALIADLFQVTVPTVNEHLKNIFEERELEPQPTIRNFRIVRREGKREVAREIEHYSLDAILAVGYRVLATWDAVSPLGHGATEGVSGQGLHDGRRAAQEPARRRVRRARLFRRVAGANSRHPRSERRMYLRVKEIFALAADYDAAQKSTVEFFKIIQNKLHFAATGHTAAELIARRADHALPNMGLTTWKGETVRKQDVTVAKNYLSEAGNPRAESHRDHVAGFRGGPGSPPQAGVLEGLGD